MIRFFSTLLFFLCFGITGAFAQDTKLTEEAITKYMNDTKEVAESVSYERYEEWVRTYLDHESLLEKNTLTQSEGRTPMESVVKLNNKQYLAMMNSDLAKRKSYKILQTVVKSMKFAENTKSAVLVWGYRFQQTVKRGFRFVPSFGTVECQELIVMNAWTEKVRVTRSVCNTKMVITAPIDEAELEKLEDSQGEDSQDE